MLRCLGGLLIGWLTGAASAMTPGPDRILQCPEPDRYIRQWTLRSGNTLGATLWSDGYVDAPMLRRPPLIARCGNDGRYFRVAEAKVMMEMYPTMSASAPRSAREAPYVARPSAQDFLAALAQGLARSRNEEIMLRTSAWWAANDVLRARTADPAATTPFSPQSAARDNLERLVEMLDVDNPDERFAKAEGSRQLARFDAARRLLEGPFPQRMQSAVRQVKQWAGERDPLVRMLATAGP